MNSLVIYSHPCTDSFNHAVLKIVREELAGAGECEVTDLYRGSFDPVITKQELRDRLVSSDVKLQQELIQRADHLVFIYPIWWCDRPAILKGWCDRVLTPGFAYQMDSDTGAPRGLLEDKSAAVIVTTGLQLEGEPAMAWSVDSMTIGTLGFCGIKNVETHILARVPGATEQARTQMLAELREGFNVKIL